MPIHLRAYRNAYMVFCLSILLSACGGGGGKDLLDGDQQLAPVVSNPQPVLPDSHLPVFPTEQWERENPAGVSVLDNKQPGRAAISMQDPGASINGDDLELDGDAGPTALYGMWRWSNFQANFPVKFNIDFDMEAGGEFYVLRTNYDKGRWDIVGPLPSDFANDGRTTYPPGNFVSPGKNTYVAVLTTAGTSMTIHEVNLLSDDDLTPPSIPENLSVSDVQPGSFTLDWDDVSDATLDGYNIYSGPSASYTREDEGVEQLNLFPVSESEFPASGLVPNTTYYVSVSSVDIVGNESGLSEIIEVNTTNDDPPGMPTGLTVDSVGSVTVNLSWTSPGDPDIQGYNIYIGDSMDFDLVDGEKQDTGLYPGTSGVREGLSPATNYYARVTAVDVFNSEGAPSDSVPFATVLDALPVPDFLVSPGHVQKGETTFFNPSATFDPDTESADLTFDWDFDDDDIIDETTEGPETVQYIFPEKGVATVTLTVSDATSSVDESKDITVNRHYKRFNLGNGKGVAGSVHGLATHPETGQVAIAFRGDDNILKMRYFNGSNWQIITMPAAQFQDIAVSPQGPAALYTEVVGNNINITVLRYTGSNWNSVFATFVNLGTPFIEFAKLAAADNGLCSVFMAYYPHPGAGDPSFRGHAFHQKSDTTAFDVDVFGSNRSPVQLGQTAIARTDTETYVLDHFGGSTALDLFTITDSTSSEQSNIQAISGSVNELYLDTDHDTAGQVFWGCLTGNGRVYYGDNYGTANGGSQFVDVSTDASELAGVGLTSDNEALIYWLNSFSTGLQELKGYTTSTSTEHTIGSDIGFATDAYGAFNDDGSGTGVWVAVEESRDGQVVARFLQDDSITETLEVHNPLGNSTIFTKAAPVVFPDDSIYSLHLQGYPVALAGNIPADHMNETLLFPGTDSFVEPHASCLTGNVDEYMTASVDLNGVVVVNTLLKGQIPATVSLIIEGSNLIDIEYSPVAGEVMFVYTTAGGNSISYQTYNGSAWSGEGLVVAAGTEIKRFSLATRSDGEFGIAYATDSNSLNFVETSGGSWGAPTEIYSGALNLVTSYIDIDYNASDSAAVVANRSSGGVWLGTIPDGGSVSWEEIDALGGDQVFSLGVRHDSAGTPVAVYLRSSTAFSGAEVFINERINGTFTPLQVASSVDILGLPLGITQDSSSNLIVCGADKAGSPRAICTIFYD